MATARNQTITVIEESEDYRVELRRKSWLIFSWWETVKVDKINGKSLHINTLEEYDEIYLNGNPLNR